MLQYATHLLLDPARHRLGCEQDFALRLLGSLPDLRDVQQARFKGAPGEAVLLRARKSLCLRLGFTWLDKVIKLKIRLLRCCVDDYTLFFLFVFVLARVRGDWRALVLPYAHSLFSCVIALEAWGLGLLALTFTRAIGGAHSVHHNTCRSLSLSSPDHLPLHSASTLR